MRAGRWAGNLRGYDSDYEPVAPEAVLARFLRSMGVPGAQVGPGLGERCSLYRSVLDGRRMLILLDNVFSYAQVEPLLPGGYRRCLLVTGRDELGELVSHGSRRVPVNRMSKDEATDVLRGVAGEVVDAHPDSTVRLGELCDGLPLALRIAGARLVTRPHWTVDTLVGRLEDESRRVAGAQPRAVEGADALVGGATAERMERDAAQAHDRRVVIPLILAVVFIVLWRCCGPWSRRYC